MMNAREYEQRVNWERRLAREWPFYRKLFARQGVKSVLDCACGPGRHALHFAGNGFEVTGADIDPAMIARARTNAASSGTVVSFLVSPFSELALRLASQKFDAVICVGNSLSQLSRLGEVGEALENMAAVCNPGGLLILHILNYESLLRREIVPQPLRIGESRGRKKIFQKIFLPGGGRVDVLMVTIRESQAGWKSEVHRGRLLPIMPSQLTHMARKSGFTGIKIQGDYAGGKFEPKSSWDLILTARRSR